MLNLTKALSMVAILCLGFYANADVTSDIDAFNKLAMEAVAKRNHDDIRNQAMQIYRKYMPIEDGDAKKSRIFLNNVNTARTALLETFPDVKAEMTRLHTLTWRSHAPRSGSKYSALFAIGAGILGGGLLMATTPEIQAATVAASPELDSDTSAGKASDRVKAISITPAAKGFESFASKSAGSK